LEIRADEKVRAFRDFSGRGCGKVRIEIKKDGSVIGNLTTAQIMIEDGTDFKGSIEIDRGEVKSGLIGS
jgi:cytoskeletal protein CcmA (bactofilin family)